MLEAKKQNEKKKIWPLKYSFVALNLVLYCTFSVSISAVSFVQLSGGGNKDIVLPISSHTHLKVGWGLTPGSYAPVIDAVIVEVMVIKATFNISVISWRSVLLVEKT